MRSNCAIISIKQIKTAFNNDEFRMRSKSAILVGAETFSGDTSVIIESIS